MQISNLTLPALELHIWFWPHLVPVGYTGSVVFSITNGSSGICSSQEILQNTVTDITSGTAEDRGDSLF